MHEKMKLDQKKTLLTNFMFKGTEKRKEIKKRQDNQLQASMKGNKYRLHISLSSTT